MKRPVKFCRCLGSSRELRWVIELNALNQIKLRRERLNVKNAMKPRMNSLNQNPVVWLGLTMLQAFCTVPEPNTQDTLMNYCLHSCRALSETSQGIYYAALVMRYS